VTGIMFIGAHQLISIVTVESCSLEPKLELWGTT